MNDLYQVLVYTDDANLLRQNINTIEKAQNFSYRSVK